MQPLDTQPYDAEQGWSVLMTEKNRQKPEKTSGKIASLSGLQERLHFGSNLTVVGAKPEQVTLSW